MIWFYLSFSIFASSLQEFLLQDSENSNHNGSFTTTHNQTPVFCNQLVRLLTFFLWAMSLLAHLHKTLMWTFWWLLSETKIGPNVTAVKNDFNITFCCFNKLICFPTHNSAMAKKCLHFENTTRPTKPISSWISITPLIPQRTYYCVKYCTNPTKIYYKYLL